VLGSGSGVRLSLFFPRLFSVCVKGVSVVGWLAGRRSMLDGLALHCWSCSSGGGLFAGLFS